MNVDKIREAINATLHAISEQDRENAERVGWALVELFDKEFNCISESDYTPDLCALQLEVIEAILELHILRGDSLDINIRFAQLGNKFKADMEHFPIWTEEDRRPAAEVLLKAIRAVENFYTRKLTTKHIPYSTESGQRVCMLCRKSPADKTGSHMVPHFLIAKVFSYDGSTNRDKVMVNVDNLAEGYNEHYFGAQVYGDAISEVLGRELTDEEVEEEIQKTNALTLDYVFCKECEDRFSIIESYYADILNGKIKDYPLAIPYLFWISVMWRMSVGKIGTVLEEKHEENLRKILNDCLAHKREEIITTGSKKGYCAYSIYKAEDTRDEQLGILGPHSPTKPYQALIGAFLINFYMNKKVAQKFCKKHQLPIKDLNTGIENEKIGKLSFIEFWQAKRQILDLIWAHDRSVWNLGQQSSQTLTQYKKVDKETESLIERLTGTRIRANEDKTWSSWATAENSSMITFPKAIIKIMEWMNAHNNILDANQIEKELGYSKEELAVFLQWFVNHVDSKLEQQEIDIHLASAIADFVNTIV